MMPVGVLGSKMWQSGYLGRSIHDPAEQDRTLSDPAPCFQSLMSGFGKSVKAAASVTTVEPDVVVCFYDPPNCG